MKKPFKLEANVIIKTAFAVGRLQLNFQLMNFNLIHFYIILLSKCEYDNKTYGIKQTYITIGCKERCVCDIINGIVSANCNSL